MAKIVKLLLLLLTANFSCSLKRQCLGGNHWIASTLGEEFIINATVPGGIYSDAMNSGIINDVFYGNADTDDFWIGREVWIYNASFPVDAELLAHSNVNLVFEGLDTFAYISINEELVAMSENMFVRYVVDVKDRLKVGDNEISIRFVPSESAASYFANTTGYVIPPECPAKEYNGICHVNQIRKMQASFSWDWGPAFASVGIWKDVYLEAFNSAVIDYVVATPLKNSDGTWNVVVQTYFSGDNKQVTGTLDIALQTEADPVVLEGISIDESSNEYDEILTTVSVPVAADIVNIWWPNGYGAQNLYNLTVTFKSGEETDEKSVRVGFRIVELIQEPLEQGLSFYFKVNGYPIFAKGANEIPINILPERGQDKTAIRKVLQTARDVNMNMLRVWGGGVYESDYFYDLADEYGILIWQDFMFACAMYPTYPEFLSNVVAEVRHQIKRLASHASIAIWAGNNENESALSNNWYNTEANFTLYKNDYLKLYIDTIRTEVLRVLPNATFITSSPTNGAESDQEGHIAKNPSDPLYGDVHFYDYTSDSWTVSTFPVPRFASEYGYQSMPSIESWLTATGNLSDLSPDTPFMDHRQHHPGGNQQNVDLIKLQLPLPEVGSENYVQAFIYFSQILQAQSIKTETEHYRSFKGRYNELQQGNTMGALYWQLNDVWVAPTWSGMDFTGRWKMLQYASQDFFQRIIVTGNLNTMDELEVYAVFDGLEVPQNLTVRGMVHVYKWDSLEPLSASQYPVTLDPLKAVLVTEIDARNTLPALGCGSSYEEAKANCFFHLHLMDQDNSQLAPTNYVFLEKLKSSNIANANLQISSVTAADDEGRKFDITLTTDVSALFVWLDSHGILGRFSENGFLQVLPSKTVTFVADEPITLEEFQQILTVTHLRDPKFQTKKCLELF